MEALIFDDLRHECPVRINGVDYILREASGKVARQYRKTLMENVRLENGKLVGLANTADVQAILVAGCLFEVMPGKNGGPSTERAVSINTVLDWPNSRLEALFERAKELSPLLDGEESSKDAIKAKIEELQKKLAEMEQIGDAEEQAKNSPSATTAGTV